MCFSQPDPPNYNPTYAPWDASKVFETGMEKDGQVTELKQNSRDPNRGGPNPTRWGNEPLPQVQMNIGQGGRT